MIEDQAVPYSTGFFDQQSGGSLASARVVLKEIFDAASIGSAVDVGCGVGSWLRAALDLGAAEVVGLDGDYVDRERLLIAPELFRPNDLEAGHLRSALRPGQRFDLAICMEVAEHLSAQRARPFIAELCDLSDLVLFSAAVPGQGGTNHINEQWPDYWARLFTEQDFACFDVLRPRLWYRDECEWWYLQNAMLFAKRDSTAFKLAGRLGAHTTAPPMPLIHPRLLPHTLKYASEHIAEQLFRYHPFGRENGVQLLEDKVERLRSMVLEKSAAIEHLQCSLERGNAELATLKHQLVQSAHERAVILQSTSWRITGVLRWAARLLSR